MSGRVKVSGEVPEHDPWETTVLELQDRRDPSRRT
jgi:hypothetical protein